MPLPPFELERYFAVHEFNAPFLLSSSDCETLRIGDLLALEPDAAGKLNDLSLGYTESAGDPGLRQDIAHLYPGLEPRHVLVHSGAEEAIHNFMLAVLVAGDHVVVHDPAYQSLYDVAASAGCEVARWAAHESAGWALDLEDLQRLLRPNTRAVVINCPHNPTGYLMDEITLRRLVDLCRERRIVLFSDEVYRDSEYRPEDRLPAACTLDDSVVSLGVMSKSFGLAGLRIGWIATRNESVMQQMAGYKDYTTLCNAAPSEFLARLALRNKETLLATNVARMRRNRALATAFFERHADRFNWIPPHGGPVAFPSLLGEESTDLFCDRLVRSQGVLLVPGRVYGPKYTRQFRIGLGRENFPQGLERFEAFL